MIDIPHKHLETIIAILSKYVPEHEVWAFGSRVNQKPKKYADLDIAIKTSAPLPAGTLALLRDAFSESNLPFKVDVVDWSKISKDFQKIIEEKFEVVQGNKSVSVKRGSK
ncbi:MAG: nucleotidyltransferase domain-containing protein [Deltaproteobacteria bacterium]|nr:nucleotidyltransferase domain-containing protein [Deltaproteobacteria bacterium]